MTIGGPPSFNEEAILDPANLGTFDKTFTPGRTYEGAIYKANNSLIYIIGGFGYDENGDADDHYLNSVWAFNVDSNEWACMINNKWTGSGSRSGSGNYNPSNYFGARKHPDGSHVVRKKGGDTEFFFYGGNNAGGGNVYADMWSYSVNKNELAWICGDNYLHVLTAFGEKMVPTDNNAITYPGSRHAGAFFLFGDNIFYHFGGLGYILDTSDDERLNTLFLYNLTTNEWMWVTGNTIENPGSNLTHPGCRSHFAYWKVEEDNEFYIFGGRGKGIGESIPTGVIFLNEMWKFNIITNEWSVVFQEGGATPICDESGTASTPGRVEKQGFDKRGDRELVVVGGHFTGIELRNYIMIFNIDNPLNEWEYISGKCDMYMSGRYSKPEEKNVYSNNVILGSRFLHHVVSLNSSELLIFGGLGRDEIDENVFLNDVIIFNFDLRLMKYMTGSVNKYKYGLYPNNNFYIEHPGRRSRTSMAVIDDYSILQFGGMGADGEYSTGVALGDFWIYDIRKNFFEYHDGSVEGDTSSFVEEYDFNSKNVIGGRHSHSMNKLYDDIFIIMGGIGREEGGTMQELGSVWLYDFERSSSYRLLNVLMTPPSYASQGQFSSANNAGSRAGFNAFVFNEKYLVVFGGYNDVNLQHLNDVFMLDTDRVVWNWMHGNLTEEKSIYGEEKNVYSESIHPSLREGSCGWKIDEQTFAIFGGKGIDGNGVLERLNDLWKFNITISQWMWLSGNDTFPGRIQSLDFDSYNVPGGRLSPSSFIIEGDDNLYIFGGEGISYSVTIPDSLSDFWVFNMSRGEWRRIGSLDDTLKGVFGRINIPSIQNIPSARAGQGFASINGKFLFWGGYGYDKFDDNRELLTDVWSYQESFACFGYIKTNPLVCSSRGSCVEDAKCVCEDNYYGQNCELNICFGVLSNESTVCSSRGSVCVDYNECICNGTFGENCEIVTCSGIRSDDPSVCKGFECIDMDVCDCGTSFDGPNCEYLQAWVTSLIVILIVLPVILLLLIVTLLGILAVLFFCRNRIKKTLTTLKAVNKLDNVELLLEEQNLEKDTDIAHLKINKKLFEIDYSELKIIKSIGKGGGSSVVFQCKYQNADVAFKCFKIQDFLTQSKFDEFEREASLLANLKHPYIIEFFGCSMRVPRIGIVIEFCAKGDIEKFLQHYKREKKSSFPFNEKIRLLKEICSGMAYLHSRKVIHRDLKCANVLVDDNLKPKIVDFGISRMIENVTQTKTRRIGTTYYIAPEVTLGDKYDEKCDVFSFSMMAYEMLSENFKPFGELDYSIEFKVAQDPSYRPSCANPEWFPKSWIVKMIGKCWKQSSKERPSFEEIVSIIEKSVEESSKEIIVKVEVVGTGKTEEMLIENELSISNIKKSIGFKWNKKEIKKLLIKKDDEMNELKDEKQLEGFENKVIIVEFERDIEELVEEVRKKILDEKKKNKMLEEKLLLLKEKHDQIF